MGRLDLLERDRGAMIVGRAPLLLRALVSAAVGLGLAWAFPPNPHPGAVVLLFAVLIAAHLRAAWLEWGTSGLLVGAGWFHLLPRAVAGHWGAEAALVMYLWVCLALALIFGAAGWLSRGWPPARRAYALALLWPAGSLAIEAASMTPILLAPAWADAPEWLSGARWWGAVGVDALALIVAGALAALTLRPRLTRAAAGPVAVAAAAILVAYGVRFAPPPATGASLSVAGLQPNVRSRDFERSTRSLYERRRIEARLDRMTADAITRGVDLVIWPEGGNELANEQLPRRVAALRRATAQTSAAVLTGSRAIGSRGEIANTAAVWSRGRPIAVAPKANPVPFAEAKLEAASPRVVEAGGARVGLSICFDALFGGHASALAARGAEVIVVTSDDASLVDPRLPAWHAAYARVRAIEVAKPLVFVSNAGPSFATEADGRLVAALRQNVRGTLAATVSLSHGSDGPPWTRWGLVALPGLFLFAARRRRGALPDRWTFAVARVVATLLVVSVAGVNAVLWSQATSAAPPPRDDLSPLFRQREQASCGAAALAFAMTYLGAEVYERDLLQATPREDPGGYSMAELARIADARGFDASGWAADLDDLEALGGAVAIGLLDVGHFVVFLSVTEASAVLFDPALGQLVEVPRPEIEGLYAGRALLLTPAAPRL